MNNLDPNAIRGVVEAVMARLLLLPQGVIESAEIILAVEGGAGKQLGIQLRPGPGGIQVMSDQKL